MGCNQEATPRTKREATGVDMYILSALVLGVPVLYAFRKPAATVKPGWLL